VQPSLAALALAVSAAAACVAFAFVASVARALALACLRRWPFVFAWLDGALSLSPASPSSAS